MKTSHMPPRSNSVWLRPFDSESSPSEDVDDELTAACIQKLTLKEDKPAKITARIGRPRIPHPSTIPTAFEVGDVKHPEWMVVQCTYLPSTKEEGGTAHGCRVIPEFFKPHNKGHKDKRTLNFTKRPPMYPSKTHTIRPTSTTARQGPEKAPTNP